MLKHRWISRWLATAAATLALTAIVAPGMAGAAPGKIKGKGDGQIRVSDADRNDVSDLGVIEIDGRIYKPSVFYVLARGDIRYSGIEFKQNFIDRIVKGALKRPF